MDEIEIVHRIGKLVDEEHAMEKAHAGSPPSESDVAKRRQIGVALDQCWDLLRQRGARRESGQNPDDAEIRPERVVEGYQQ
ncbi:MAG: DUF2630 family protein [Ilumatobacteraceae bacterium]